KSPARDSNAVGGKFAGTQATSRGTLKFEVTIQVREGQDLTGRASVTVVHRELICNCSVSRIYYKVHEIIGDYPGDGASAQGVNSRRIVSLGKRLVCLEQ
ncbi:MAG: hypothetical protein KAX38_07715, partial [Candidatus Krumholzibacteria bacterium]|nr:hypothetical protein [Candidatus Krumholzibacteria bacterium]